MLSRQMLIAVAVLMAATAAQAQVRRDTATFAPDPAATSEAPAAAADDGNIKWRSPNTLPTGTTAQPVGQPAPGQLVPGQPAAGQPVGQPAPQQFGGQPAGIRAVPPTTPRAPIAKVTRGPGTLPNDAGQEWREYDITPYTARVTSTVRPEQAILDWILRETGYETWHTTPLAILSVDSRRVSVYHTPQMHQIVQDVVDRFVNSEAEAYVFGMRVITLKSPDWRAKHHKQLQPVATQTQGVQAWLMAKEDAALMVADLRRRSDFQEHSTPHLMVNNGQSKQVSANQTRNYMRDVLLKPEGWPGYEPQMAQFDEGFKLEFSPLLSLDSQVVDAVLRCEIDRVEKMVPVNIDVPTVAAPRQRQKIEVPQPISTRLHERFRWPADRVLVISLGVGPAPVPTPASGLSVPLISGPPRADLLILVESRGKVGSQPTALQPGQREASLYQNRYYRR